MRQSDTPLPPPPRRTSKTEWENDHVQAGNERGWRKWGEPAAGGLQMWWLRGRATLARFGAPRSTLLPFSFHRSSSSFSDSNHLAWQRERRCSREFHPPECGPCLHKQIKCTHIHAQYRPFPPPEAVTWLLNPSSCGPAVLHYDKYTRVARSCQLGAGHQILKGVHLQPFKAHFAK